MTPRTKKDLRKIINQSRFIKLIPGRNEEYEVHEGPCRFAMSLDKRTCSCGWWAISRLPCKYATRVIVYKRVDMEDYCDETFTIETYKRVYNYAIHPIPNRTLEVDDEHPPLQLPPLKRQPRRPRKARIREESEAGPTPK